MSDDSSTTSVMVDLETLGRNPGCSIISIGAVTFNQDGLGDTFYRSISRDSCEELGLEEDEDTLGWWYSQDEEVKDVLWGGLDISDVLLEFNQFYGDTDVIWGHAPSFDCAILKDAYGRVGLTEPWQYYEERCSRTVSELPIAPDLERKGDHHNALDDAKHQARVVIETLDRMQPSLSDFQ